MTYKAAPEGNAAALTGACPQSVCSKLADLSVGFDSDASEVEPVSPSVNFPEWKWLKFEKSAVR
jgi:hypothetical protein